VTLEAAIAVLLIWRAPLLPNLIGLLVVLAEMLLVGGLVWRQPALVAWSIVLVGAAYGLSLVGQRESVDATALLVAAVLFLAAEVAYLAVDEGAFSGIPIRPLAAAIAVAIGSMVISVILLAIGQSVPVAGPLLTAGGVAATLVLLGLVIATAARRAHP
jgi:hypothetical protein